MRYCLKYCVWFSVNCDNRDLLHFILQMLGERGINYFRINEIWINKWLKKNKRGRTILVYVLLLQCLFVYWYVNDHILCRNRSIQKLLALTLFHYKNCHRNINNKYFKPLISNISSITHFEYSPLRFKQKTPRNLLID